MEGFIVGALGVRCTEVASSTKTGGGDGDMGLAETRCIAREGGWSQLCANKHLAEDETFKRVREACNIVRD